MAEVTMTGEQAVKAIVDLQEEARKHKDDQAALRAKFEQVEADLKAATQTIAEMSRPKVYGSSGDGTFKSLGLTKQDQANPTKALSIAQKHPARNGSDLESFQTVADAVHFLAAAAASKHADPKFVRHFLESDIVKAYNGYMQELTGKDAAIDTTEFSTWLIAPFVSAGFRDRVRDAQRLGPLFEQIPMGSFTHKEPGLSADHNTYTWTENTATEGTKITGAVDTPFTAQLDAVNMGVRVVWSMHSVEDFGPTRANYSLNKMARVMAEGIDRAILNGDTTGTHRDTGDSIGATDSRKMWMGLRYSAVDATYTTDPGTSITLTPAVLISSRGAMGKYGGSQGRLGGLFHVGPYSQYFKLLADDNLLKWINYGPAATILKGEFIIVGGVPFYPSEWLFTTGYTAAGVHDGSGTRSIALTVHAPAWGLGTWRDITVKSSDIIAMEYDQIVAVATWRGDFEDLYPIASNRIVDYIVDLNA